MMNNYKDLKIIYFGTPEFATQSLKALVENGCNVIATVTAPDKIAGRGHKLLQSDVKKYSLEHGIKCLQPEKLRDKTFIDTLKQLNADIFIVIAFRMLPEVVWGMPPLGTFNLHASLLPSYRGAAPINRALMNGESKTGVTAFFLSQEIDKGDIFASESLDIMPEDNAGTLHDKLMDLAARMVMSSIKQIASGDFSRIPQPGGDFIPAPKIFHEDCIINWKSSAEKIHNQIRGLSPYPAARIISVDENGTESEIKVFESTICSEYIDMPNMNPGEIRISGRRLFVGSGKGILEILSLQPAGKKRMDTSAYILGYKPVRFK